MRKSKVIGLAVLLSALALTGRPALAGVLNAVLHGSGNGIISSGSLVSFDLSSSYFDPNDPHISANTSGIIDQYRFDFNDGSIPTGWLTTPYTDLTFVGAEGQLFFVTGEVRWSQLPNEISSDFLRIEISNQGQLGGNNVPEPGSYALMFTALGALRFAMHRRKASAT